MTIFFIALLPLAAGVLLAILPLKRRAREVYVGAVTLLTSALAAFAVLSADQRVFTLFSVTDRFTFAFSLDGAGKLFIGLAAFLWPLAALYAFEYMKHEEREGRFFAYYTMTYGITICVAAAANLFTLYVLCELMTLMTLPLVWHKLDKPSVRGARKYVLYSIGGAALSFIAMILLSRYSEVAFVPGGSLSAAMPYAPLLPLLFMLSFIGFGAKASVFPMGAWLPAVTSAPTPVTALLHAVTVVNTGAFSVIRLIYYVFGPDSLRGTWAQSAALALSAFTLLYGAVMAVKEQHMKRRLAYSTMSNLSYMLLAACLMTGAGQAAALIHMVSHGLMKIILFYCSGAVWLATGRTQVHETYGLARKMPLTFALFTLAATALTGVPLFCGFISKFRILTAAVDEGSAMAIAGAVSLIAATVLTFVYTFTIVIPAYFLPLSAGGLPGPATRGASFRLMAPLLVIAAAVIILGILPEPLLRFIDAAAGL
jgi:multicomponent Na+:H+ antiporter subunit D